MYREVAKLIIYGNHEDTILMKMSDIFKKIDRDEETPDKLISDIYEQIKRILEVATDYGFDKNLWHNYLTFYLITNENPFSLTCEKVGANDGSVNEFAKNDFKVFMISDLLRLHLESTVFYLYLITRQLLRKSLCTIRM